MTTDDFSNITKNSYSEPAVDCDWGAFKKVLMSRRSVRVFEKALVPENHYASAFLSMGSR